MKAQDGIDSDRSTRQPCGHVAAVTLQLGEASGLAEETKEKEAAHRDRGPWWEARRGPARPAAWGRPPRHLSAWSLFHLSAWSLFHQSHSCP